MGEELDAASVVSSLRATFKSGRTRPLSWRLQQVDALAKLLLDHETEINDALYSDLGKSPFEAFCTEIAIIFNSCDLLRANLKKWMVPEKVSLPLPLRPGRCEIVPEPLGVALIFSAWNFPLLLALDPLLGAIAAGNAAVLKPSEVAPAVSSLLARLIPMYLDSSAVKVVEGGIPESTALLVQKWDKIFYTGSTHVGRIIMTAAAKHLTPVTLELGGKSPTIVDSSADLEVAARRIVSGKWGINCGQACLAPDYILVEEKTAQSLITVLKKTVEACFGTELGESPSLTRIVNKRHFMRLKEMLDEPNTAKTIIYGGQCNEGKLLIQPTLMLNPPLDSPVMTEEIFGPILPIITVETMSEAIDFVSSKDKSLALYLFTNKEEVKKKVSLETSAGSMVVNDAVVQFGVDAIPFGGVGASGMGCYHGRHSFEAFSHKKPVVLRDTWGDATVRYPPYTESKQRVLRAIVRFDYFKVLLIMLGLKR